MQYIADTFNKPTTIQMTDDDKLKAITELSHQRREEDCVPEMSLDYDPVLKTIDDLYQSIQSSFDRFLPETLTQDDWSIMQLFTLLDNILLDNPKLKEYYQNFIDTLNSL